MSDSDFHVWYTVAKPKGGKWYQARLVRVNEADLHGVQIHLAEVMTSRRVTNEALAEAIGVSPNNLSRLKNGDVELLRLTTLAAICRELKCQPGDLLTYIDTE